MSRGTKLVGTTILLMMVTLFTKAIGFVREIFIAAKFGATEAADIFVAVQTIPVIILSVMSGAIAAVLIPMIVQLRNSGETIRLKQLLHSVFSLTSLLMIAFSIVAFLLIEPFVDVYVFGFDEAAKAHTVELFQIIIPAFIVIGLISLTTSVLNAYNIYILPSLGPAIYSIGVISGLLFFSERFGVKSLIVGYAIAVVIQLIILLVVVFKQGLSFRLRITINADLKKFGILLLPLVFSIGVFQLNAVVDKMMASTLNEGSLAALNYAYKVTQLPMALFVSSLVLPLFPMIADSISRDDLGDAKMILRRSNRILAMVLLPVMGLFAVMSEPIITIIYQRGAFDTHAMKMTSLALLFYSLTILPFAMRDIVTRILYALQDTWTPVINSVFIVAINLLLMVIFVPKFGIIAVAGSTSVSGLFGYLRLRSKLIKKVGPLNDFGRSADTDSSFAKNVWLRILINAIVFTLAAWLFYQGLKLFMPGELGLDLWLRTGISVLAAAGIYLGLTLSMDIEEVKWLKSKIKRVMKCSS